MICHQNQTGFQGKFIYNLTHSFFINIMKFKVVVMLFCQIISKAFIRRYSDFMVKCQSYVSEERVKLIRYEQFICNYIIIISEKSRDRFLSFSFTKYIIYGFPSASYDIFKFLNIDSIILFGTLLKNFIIGVQISFC